MLKNILSVVASLSLLAAAPAFANKGEKVEAKGEKIEKKAEKAEKPAATK